MKTGNSKANVFGLALFALLFALCLPLEAQQAGKVYRVGYLSSVDPATESTRSQAIRQALRKLGYVEGQNIAFENRYGDEKLGMDGRAELAAELVRLKVDIIVVTGGPGWVFRAKQATTMIPIVMVGGGTDPVKASLVESLARPGGNVTGLTNLGPELGGKRLELFKEAVPKVVHVAAIYDFEVFFYGPRFVKDILPVTAQALGLTIQPWFARDPDELEKVFDALIKQRPDGLYMDPGGPQMFANQKRIADFALKSRIPSIYGRSDAVDVGGLMSYGADLTDSYRRVAYYVDRILKGAKPADLPVEQPAKFELAINPNTANEIGVTIPQSVLYRADKVIK